MSKECWLIFVKSVKDSNKGIELIFYFLDALETPRKEEKSNLS
jgi:hypothetical protein